MILVGFITLLFSILPNFFNLSSIDRFTYSGFFPQKFLIKKLFSNNSFQVILLPSSYFSFKKSINIS